MLLDDELLSLIEIVVAVVVVDDGRLVVQSIHDLGNNGTKRSWAALPVII